ncbi:MAG TPA: hypothetical protein VGB85_33450 [Nannocystis sp.]|jgi:hypothetical protein
MRRLYVVFVANVCGAPVGCGGEGAEDTGETASGTTGETTGETTAPTTGEATSGGGSGEYTAFYVPPGNGQYTRIVVRRVDVEENLCATVGFISLPEIEEGYAITTPAMWAAEWAFVQQEGTDCLSVYQLASEPADAESGLGTVTWPQDVACPPTVDIDVTLKFASEPAWAPAEVQLKAEGIAVQGC